MTDRTGSTSSFPSSLDQFEIKTSFNSELPLSQQATTSLEQAAHFNHMFDAVVNLENHVLAGSGGIGASVVTRWSSGITGSEEDIYGSNLKLGYSTISLTLTGDTYTATAMVPTSFGNDPFSLKGFAIGHSFSLDGTSSTQGLWANNSWGTEGPFNEMIKFYQFFTMIKPVTGRVFEYTIRNFPFHTSSETISSIFTDAMKLVTGLSWENLHVRTGWTGTGVDGLYVAPTVNGNTYWVAACEISNGDRWGWAYSTKLGVMTDSYVEWGEIVEYFVNTNFVEGQEVAYRLGPMVRATGTVTNANFYCLAIGDVPISFTGNQDIGKYAQILKVTGANLSYNGGDGQGRQVIGVWPAGTAVPPSAAASGFKWVGDISTRYRLKCETVTGSAKLTIQSSPSPYSVWSDLYGPYYDGTDPFLSGYSGFFAQAMNDSNHRWAKFYGEVSIVNLNSDTSVSGDLQLMFALVGPEANLSVESGA